MAYGSDDLFEFMEESGREEYKDSLLNAESNNTQNEESIGEDNVDTGSLKDYIRRTFKTRAILKPGMVTEREIMHYHHLRKFRFIDMKKFDNQVKQFLATIDPECIMEKDAVQLLHSACIEFLLDMFEGSGAFMRHCYRSVLQPEDMWQYLRIKGLQVERPFGDPIRSEDEDIIDDSLPNIVELQSRMMDIDQRDPIRLTNRDYDCISKYEDSLATGEVMNGKLSRRYKRVMKKIGSRGNKEKSHEPHN